MTDLQQPPPQPPWQPGPPPPQQPYQPTPEAPKRNGQAIAGIILAIIGCIGSAAGGGVAAAVLFCVAGLALSIVGVAIAGQRRSGRGLGVAGIVIACVGLIACLGASTNKSSSTATTSAPSYSAPSYSAPATQSLPAGTYTAGTYVVGSDIQPGTYSTPGIANTGSILCQWFRLKDTTGDTSSFLDFGNSDGPTTITIKPSDGAVEFQGNCQWTKR